MVRKTEGVWGTVQLEDSVCIQTNDLSQLEDLEKKYMFLCTRKA